LSTHVDALSKKTTMTKEVTMGLPGQRTAFSTLSPCDFTPKADLDDRVCKLRQEMVEKGISFAMILQNVDLLYFSGTLQKGIFVIPAEKEPILFVERNVERAVIETPLPVTRIERDRDIRQILVDCGVLKGKGGMELDVLPVAAFERWRNILGFGEFTDISPLIRNIRAVKSPFELSQIKRSGEICTHVFERAKDALREGRREVDISAALEAEGREAGHQGYLRMRGFNQEPMNICVAHGLSATVPSGGNVPIAGVGTTHAIAQGPSLGRLERGTPVLIDYCGGYNGYTTDETRTFAIGRLKERFRKPYEVARQIIEEAMVLGRDGLDATELFNLALQTAGKAGLEEYFMGYGHGKVSFIGHGLGLELNELPVITPSYHITLREGMVFAFEPKFVFPGEGAVGIEVDFIVGQKGLKRVTTSPIDTI